MNASGKTLALVQTCVRHFGQSAVRRSAQTEVASSKFKQLKETQKHFGIEDHTPIYIKGGFGDKALYGITLAMTLVGLGLSGETLFRLSFK